MTVERTRLPDRRPSVTQKVRHVLASGSHQDVLITFSFNNDGHVREIFSADFKAGTDAQALIVDACILASRLLQHGNTPEMLLGSMCEPRSLIGSMLVVATELDGRGTRG